MAAAEYRPQKQLDGKIWFALDLVVFAKELIIEGYKFVPRSFTQIMKAQLFGKSWLLLQALKQLDGKILFVVDLVIFTKELIIEGYKFVPRHSHRSWKHNCLGKVDRCYRP